ncbi:MAG: rod shape-determining protein MreC [Chitinophagaceae bacterium]|nr:rod shape-determining protein MreC [Chitinophagaceae bacterium]
MRNIFLFIRRYFNFLFFLVLQIIALSFLFRYNKFHEAAFMGVANEITGRIGNQYSNVEYYFHLKKTNEALASQNESLLNALKDNIQGPDTASIFVRDTLSFDSLRRDARKYIWREARVVNKSVSLQNNYLTIHRGEKQGVTKDMGVTSPNGIVGIVVNTSENFAVVMTILNRRSSISAKLKKTGEITKIQWDGDSPEFVTMTNLPVSVPVAKGDSVITSGYSLAFPPGILIGTIDEVINDQSSNFYTLKVKTATDFYNVEYVYVVDNMQREEQKKLEEATQRNQ